MIPLTDQRPEARRGWLTPPSRGTGRESEDRATHEIAEEISRGDFQDINHALTGRWPMSQANRLRLMATLNYIIAHADTFEPRIVLNACQAMLNADRINMDEEAVERSKPKPIVIEAGERVKLDFSKLTDDELTAFIEGGYSG